MTSDRAPRSILSAAVPGCGSHPPIKAICLKVSADIPPRVLKIQIAATKRPLAGM